MNSIETEEKNEEVIPLLGKEIRGKGTNFSSIALIGYKKRGYRVEMVLNRSYWVQKFEGKGRTGPQSPLLGTKIEGKGTNLFSIAFIEYKKRGKRVEIVLNRPYWVQKIEQKDQNGPQSPLLSTISGEKGSK
ncbi:hypothetical protein [Cytobacillus praedii]|uniref:hypothetical protein n=1 Tax=Cytobacillus praedii TaxID=1742358 RepID=UPI002E23E652|nr:hypothetical protein [Cytobacillus praedii]